MNKKFFYALAFLPLFGCSLIKDNDTRIKPFKFLLLKTSYKKSKSEIEFFDKEWNSTQKIFFGFGGLGGISQRKVKQYNNRIYMIAMGATSNPFEKILEIHLESGKSRFFETEVFPTDLEIYNNKLYVVHNSNINSSTVISIDLDTKKIIDKNVLNGVLPAISPPKSGFFYVTTENPSKGNQNIYKLDFNLKIKSKIENNETATNSDFLINGSDIMIFNKSNSNLKDPTTLLPTNKILKLNQEDRESYIKLSEISPYQAFDAGSSVIITHNYPTEPKGYVTRMDKKTSRQELFALASTVSNASIQNNSLYVLGNPPGKRGSVEKMYEYHLDDFKLKRVFNLQLDKDRTYASKVMVRDGSLS